jgi:hypothetical protein
MWVLEKPPWFFSGNSSTHHPVSTLYQSPHLKSELPNLHTDHTHTIPPLSTRTRTHTHTHTHTHPLSRKTWVCLGCVWHWYFCCCCCCAIVTPHPIVEKEARWRKSHTWWHRSCVCNDPQRGPTVPSGLQCIGHPTLQDDSHDGRSDTSCCWEAPLIRLNRLG